MVKRRRAFRRPRICELGVDRTSFPEILAALDRATDPVTGRVTVRAQVSISEDAAAAIGFMMRVQLDARRGERDGV
jgi:hypothetical protein